MSLPQLGTLRIPPLVLQPVVENAVKHGIGSLVRGGCIVISARVEPVAASDASNGAGNVAGQQQLCLTVTDTGIGTAAAQLARRRQNGTGLANIERRLDRYFGAAASLSIRSAVGVGTTVDIRLPATVRDGCCSRGGVEVRRWPPLHAARATRARRSSRIGAPRAIVS